MHHEHGYHRRNYADVTWWDRLFGTYENPRDFTMTCGFEDWREQRLGDMLLGKDVHAEERT